METFWQNDKEVNKSTARSKHPCSMLLRSIFGPSLDMINIESDDNIDNNYLCRRANPTNERNGTSNHFNRRN